MLTRIRARTLRRCCHDLRDDNSNCSTCLLILFDAYHYPTEYATCFDAARARILYTLYAFEGSSTLLLIRAAASFVRYHIDHHSSWDCLWPFGFGKDTDTPGVFLDVCSAAALEPIHQCWNHLGRFTCCRQQSTPTSCLLLLTCFASSATRRGNPIWYPCSILSKEHRQSLREDCTVGPFSI